MAKSTPSQPPLVQLPATDPSLLGAFRQLIEQARAHVATCGKGFSARKQSQLHRVLLSRERQARGDDNKDKKRDGQS